MKSEHQGRADMEIVEDSMTDTADAMSVETGTTVNVCVINVSTYHKEDLFVRIEEIEDPGIPLRDGACLS